MKKRDCHPVKAWSHTHPSQLALVTLEKVYTWQALAKRVDNLAASLFHQGVKKGQVVTAIGKNSPDLLFLLLACHQLGAISAIVMPRPEKELEACFSTLYSSTQSRLCWSEDGDGFSGLDVSFDGALTTTTDTDFCLSDPATIIFTSGTSGRPKAVLHSHQQHLASAAGLLTRFSYQPTDTWLLSLPLYHVSGMAIVYRWLQAGGILKLGSGKLEEDVKGVSHASLVPVQLARLLDKPQQLELKRVLLGGSHIPPDLCRRAQQHGIDTWLGYGMTEMASTVTAKPYDAQLGAGFSLPHRHIKVVDNRIWVKGAPLALGYYQQGKVETLCNDEGWFDSKDLGILHGGQLVIKGRVDNQFISGGENIHCEEIEAALMLMPHIAFAMVIAQEDHEFGHRPVAYVNWSDTAPTAKQIEQHLSQHLVKFKWPDAYYLLPPKLLASGIKVSRKALADFHKNRVS